MCAFYECTGRLDGRIIASPVMMQHSMVCGAREYCRFFLLMLMWCMYQLLMQQGRTLTFFDINVNTCREWALIRLPGACFTFTFADSCTCDPLMSYPLSSRHCLVDSPGHIVTPVGGAHYAEFRESATHNTLARGT